MMRPAVTWLHDWWGQRMSDDADRCVEDGCPRRATTERLDAMDGDHMLFEQVCRRHSDGSGVLVHALGLPRGGDR